MTGSGETETRLRALARKLEALSAVGAPTSERARVRSEHARVLRAVDAEQALANALLALSEAHSIEAEEPEETRARTVAACEATVAICYQTAGDDASRARARALGPRGARRPRGRPHALPPAQRAGRRLQQLRAGRPRPRLLRGGARGGRAPPGRDAALGAQHEHRLRLPRDPRPARSRDPAPRPRARDRGRRADRARLGAAGARAGAERTRRARGSRSASRATPRASRSATACSAA